MCLVPETEYKNEVPFKFYDFNFLFYLYLMTIKLFENLNKQNYDLNRVLTLTLNLLFEPRINGNVSYLPCTDLLPPFGLLSSALI